MKHVCDSLSLRPIVYAGLYFVHFVFMTVFIFGILRIRFESYLILSLRGKVPLVPHTASKRNNIIISLDIS